jgi:hypothetical protein
MSSQVHALLMEISLGRHYFQIGLLLRDTNVINAMLFSAECWYGVTNNQLVKLENVDLGFLRKLFKGHCKTAKEAYYLETGKIPPKFIIINRRLMFLKQILNSNKEGLLSRFFHLQKACPVKNDWVTQVEKDKDDIELFLSDNEIAEMSKNQFKKLVKSHISIAALNHLNKLAENHSKSRNLMKKEIKCSKYMKDMRFSVTEVQLLFQLRTRMFPVKINFRNNYLNLSCEYCNLQNCDQEHQLSCHVMKKFIPELTNTKVKYQDLFGSVDKQLSFIKLYTKIARQREILLESLSI